MAAPLVAYSLSEDSNGTLSSVGELPQDLNFKIQPMQNNDADGSVVWALSDEESVIGKEILDAIGGNAIGVAVPEIDERFVPADLEEGSGENEVNGCADTVLEEGDEDQAAVDELDRLSTNQDELDAKIADADDEEDDACSRPTKKLRN